MSLATLALSDYGVVAATDGTANWAIRIAAVRVEYGAYYT